MAKDQHGLAALSMGIRRERRWRRHTAALGCAWINRGNRMRHISFALLLVLAACTAAPDAPAASSQVTLTGEITRADHQTYREIPFEVPPGTERIAVDFSYTGKDQRTVIDIGMRDPQGQRGWSGGNKSRFEITEFASTPSYANGPITPGTWHLVLGVPNIREGQTASYTATITLGPSDGARKAVQLSDPAIVLDPAPGWRRGDFHTHTGHSDGSCDVGDARVPCPAVFTFEAAKAAGLDFVALTEHNTITQLADIRELQDAFPNTLLMPGTEITTFFGHANAVGNTSFLDFQLGSQRLPTLSKLFDQVDAVGGFLSVNHPALPSGEACMGCGWTAKDTDWSRVSAIEIVNGSTLRTSGAEGTFNGIKFWESLLNQGHRITAIGGSDNHDAKDTNGARQSPVGKPTTVVFAEELSTRGVVAGVKSGRVFVDAAGLPGARLDMKASATNKSVAMGGELALSAAENATIAASTNALPPGARVEWISNGLVVSIPSDPAASEAKLVQLATDSRHGWIRVNIRDVDGKLLLIGNPIYFRAND
jgi:hypothetical protein